ncbi:unnamed protein product, partial [Mesorhabditis spiculigera]
MAAKLAYTLFSFSFLFSLAVDGIVVELRGPSSAERRLHYDMLSSYSSGSLRDEKGIPTIGPYVKGLSIGTPYQPMQKISLTTTSADLLIFSKNFTRPAWAFDEEASDTFEWMNSTYTNLTATVDGSQMRMNGRVCMESFQFNHEVELFQDYILYFALIDSASNNSNEYPGNGISGIMGLVAFLNDADYEKGVTLNSYTCDQGGLQETVGIFSVSAHLDSAHCDRRQYIETPIYYDEQWSLHIPSFTYNGYDSKKGTIATINIQQLALGMPDDLYAQVAKVLGVDPSANFPYIDCDEDFPQISLKLTNGTVTLGATAYIDKFADFPATCRLIAYPIKATGFLNAWVFGYSVMVDQCLFLGWDRRVVGFAPATAKC